MCETLILLERQRLCRTKTRLQIGGDKVIGQNNHEFLAKQQNNRPAPKINRLLGRITYSGQDLTFKLAGFDSEVAYFSVDTRPNFRVHIKVEQLQA